MTREEKLGIIIDGIENLDNVANGNCPEEMEFYRKAIT